MRSVDRPLAPRQRQVLALVAGGQSNKEIARALGLGLSTVKNTLGEIYWKLGVRNRTEAVVWWYRKGAHGGNSDAR